MTSPLHDTRAEITSVPALLTEVEPRAEAWLALLATRIAERTQRHVVSVAVSMLGLTEATGMRPDQAVAAGLLHDLCKGMDDAALLEAARRYGLTVTALQHRRPKLLHGPVAAEECRLELGVDDLGVCEAIRWHTTGKPGLGPTGLALYFADYAEPLRTHPQAAVARDLLEKQGFREALRFVAARKLEHVLTRAVVDPMTRAFHEWLEGAG